MGLSLAYQPLVGCRLVSHGLAKPHHHSAGYCRVSVALAYIDNRLIRRSLQLSLILCAILHVALVVQMLNTHLFSGAAPQAHVKLEIAEPRPLKIVPEYHPTQLVPEEDRPRQDFEKPIETESPKPAQEPLQIVREPSEQEHSPSQPQPVPIPSKNRRRSPTS